MREVFDPSSDEAPAKRTHAVEQRAEILKQSAAVCNCPSHHTQRSVFWLGDGHGGQRLYHDHSALVPPFAAARQLLPFR
jgi:hypothetical protein